MNITPQDILEQEFHVRFRGFDMSEVDAFLERVAENYFKTLEENQRLNEQVEELQKSRPATGNLDTGLQEAVASVQEAASQIKSFDQQQQPADLSGALSELKQVAENISSELAGMKEDRQALSNLEGNLREVLASATDVAKDNQSPDSQGASTALPRAFDELRQSSENIGTELAGLKKDIAALQQTREQARTEVQELLQKNLGQLEERFLKELRNAALAPAEIEKTPAKKPAQKAKTKPPKDEVEVLESRVLDSDAELPGYEDKEPDDGTKYDEGDILNEDKLRDLFASIMDDDESPREAETANDILFGGENLVKDDHEPEVTFILDDALEEDESGAQADKKPDN
jgi:cell division initiation protein